MKTLIKTSLTIIILTVFSVQVEAQWTTSGSNIYYNTGGVGIGVTNPRVKLQVNSSIESHTTLIRSFGNQLSSDFVTSNSYRSFSGSVLTDGSTCCISRFMSYNSIFGGYANYNNQGYGFYSQGHYPRMFMEVTSGDHGTFTGLPSDSPIKNGYIYQQIKGPIGNALSAPIKATNTNSTWLWGIKGNGDAIFYAGNLGVGTESPDQKLTVAGMVKSQEILVDENTGADFVFEEDYDLPTLAQIEKFIKANKHLEGIAPAKEMKENGVKIGELQIKLLQKIEELTLHTIEQQKLIEQQSKVNRELLKRIEKLENKE